MKTPKYEIHAGPFVATGYCVLNKEITVLFSHTASGTKPWRLGPELAEAMVERARAEGWDGAAVQVVPPPIPILDEIQ
jgi:lipocalin